MFRYSLFIAGRSPHTFALIISEFGGLHETHSFRCRSAATVNSSVVPVGWVRLCTGRKNHVGGRHHRIPAPDEWASDFALPGFIQAHNHRQHNLSRRVAARKLWRNRNGSPARAFALQGIEKSPERSERTSGSRVTSEWDDVVRSHQLFRNVSSIGRQPRVGSGSGS